MEEMDSKIHERISRSLENDTDIRAKNARAILDEERAKKLRSETDMLDKEFVKDITGLSYQEKIKQDEFARQAEASAREHTAMVNIDQKMLEKDLGLHDKPTKTPGSKG